MSIVKSFSVGDGDMFYIRHDSDNFTIIDCCMSDENKDDIVDELKSESKNKGIVRFISTHPDNDHILGLTYLDDEMQLLNFYCVKNAATKPDETRDFLRYCTLRDDSDKAFYIFKGCTRRWMNQHSEERGSAGINILWPITSNQHYKEALAKANDGESPNNISPIVRYSLQDGAKIQWMGDLETDFMEKIENEIEMDSVDVLFAPHHGRESGKVLTGWLDDMSPKIVVVGEADSKYLD